MNWYRCFESFLGDKLVNPPTIHSTISKNSQDCSSDESKTLESKIPEVQFATKTVAKRKSQKVSN